MFAIICAVEICVVFKIKLVDLSTIFVDIASGIVYYTTVDKSTFKDFYGKNIRNVYRNHFKNQ